MAFISCQEKEYTHADLSFKLINMGSFYGADEAEIQIFEKLFDSIKKDPDAGKEDKKLCDFFSRLKKNGLYTSPYIHLQIGPDSSLLVYLNETEYEKVKEYKADELLERMKKVSLELDIEKRDEGIYFVNQIINVQETDGQTILVK